jgi:hypothetical protein
VDDGLRRSESRIPQQFRTDTVGDTMNDLGSVVNGSIAHAWIKRGLADERERN